MTDTQTSASSLDSSGKSPMKSATIQGAVLSILASIGSLAVVIKGGVPPEILIPAVTATAGAIWGNLLSIFGRMKATQKIK